MITYDRYTIDSTGAFMIGELERLDQTLHEPLVAVTWGRDIDLREDVSMADDASSFTNSTFAAAGSMDSSGKNFIGKNSNAIPGVAVDIGKTSNPLYLWGMEVSYTIPELMSAQQLGRPVDAQKYQGMQLKWQMDIDEMVYVGDKAVNQYGMLNNTNVDSTSFVEEGAKGATQWSEKTHDEILKDINDFIVDCWENAGTAVCPSKLLLPPAQFAQITSRKVSDAGNISILQFIEDNCIALKINGKKLDIQPCKWLTGLGTQAGSPAAGTDRMVCYSQDKNRLRYPLVPLQRTPLEYRSIYHLTTYFGKLGVVEIVYPDTILYRDGI